MKHLLENESFDFQYTCGYNKVLSLSSKDQFVKDTCMHYVIYSVHTELTQLRYAMMQTLQMEKFSQQNPVELWSMLSIDHNKKVTTALMQGLFVAVYSPSGSSRRNCEERVMMFFYDFLQSCEGN